MQFLKAFAIVVALPLFISGSIEAQSADGGPSAPLFGPRFFIDGYGRALQGETIAYYSIYPKYVKDALLTRCTDGKKVIEWETDIVPSDVKGPYAYFSWIAAHSDGSSSGDRYFDLYINDNYALTFTTHKKDYPPYWTFGGSDSTRIVFEYRKRDGADDAHGMAYLRVPLSRCVPGKTLRIKVVGKAQESNDWYMTFRYSFRERIDVAALPFLLKGEKGPQQPIQITVLHFGGPQAMRVSVDNVRSVEQTVRDGFTVLNIPVRAVQEKRKIRLQAAIGNLLKMDTSLWLKPVNYREIDLVHHAHTDIGYSHIQEDVIKIHVEDIRRALRLIGRTRDYPEGSQFIWNIESSWAVEHFLSQATEEEKRSFYQAVKDKHIVISATYANILTGLCIPEEMDWITEYSRKLRDSLHLPINTAMMSDVPGMSWSMVASLASNGIRYFSNGPNYVENFPDKGDRVGGTIREQGNKAFWWKSATGKDSILFWTCGKGYSSWHGFAQGAIAERGTEKIADYLNELDSIHYPYEMVQWRYNVVADNGPTDSTIADFVKQWNEKYISPKLVLAAAPDMFARFEKRYGKSIPVLSGDFTPYWEDGAYSTAKEETLVRLSSEKLAELLEVIRQHHIVVSPALLYSAKKNIVLFHEHTWGAWCSISQPDADFTIHQWLYKKRFADSATIFVDSIAGIVEKAVAKPGRIVVMNTLSWARSGYVEMSCPSSFSGNVLTDEGGRSVAVQRLTDGKIGFIAMGVPAKGEKVYRFSADATNSGSVLSGAAISASSSGALPGSSLGSVLVSSSGSASGPSSEAGNLGGVNGFSGGRIAYRIDSVTGAIKSLRTGGKEWVDPRNYKGLLQALYVHGLDPSVFASSAVRKIERLENGPVCRKLRITCDMQGANNVVYEITQYAHLDYLQLTALIDKQPVREKESVHIALPFALSGPRVRIGLGQGVVSPEQGQIPGSNKDFFSIQRWIDVSNSGRGVTIISPQGALFEYGSMINEERVLNGYKKWKRSASSSSNIFLYAMNNYWHTNYKADQDGVVTFDLYLHFHGAFDQKSADRFGYETTQPLIGVGR